MTTKPHILIAGAGLGGLTAALSLLRNGFDVDVFERASDLREIGAGVQLAANGTRVLIELGLGTELDRIGTALDGKEIRIWNTGRSRKFIDLGAASIERYGAPYRAVHRADLLGALAQAVRAIKPGAIHLNASVTGFEQGGERVKLRFENHEPVSGDALVGADGVHSKIRQTIFGPDRAKFTGCMAWRGLIPTAGLSETITRTGGVFWLGPGAHIVTYPVRHGAELNFIGVINRDDWTVESWTARGTEEECLADFKGWHGDVHAMVRGIAIPYKWALVVREPLPAWSHDRVTLLGDACHSMLPLLAQGANMSLEDACVIGRSLAKHRDDLAAGLKSYEAARLDRTTKIVRASASQLERNTSEALRDPATAEAYVAEQWTQDRVNDRYDWVYGYDAVGTPIQ